MFVKYRHNFSSGDSCEEWVRTDLKGQHRRHCLCTYCQKFKPDNRSENCRAANTLFALDLAENIVTPVWECPKFEARSDMLTDFVEALEAAEVTEIRSVDELAQLKYVGLVYIAGPYRSSNNKSVLQNIRTAELVSMHCLRHGVTFHCPHLNTRGMSGEGSHAGVTEDTQTFLDIDKKIILKCDALLLFDDDWKMSKGTQGEFILARNMGIPIYHLSDAVLVEGRRYAS